MKKTKYPLLTKLELINKNKLVFGFYGGDLYQRSKDKLGEFGWADKWEDIHNCLKIIYPLLDNLINDQQRKKITGFDWVITYGVPNIDQIKQFKKDKKYKRLGKSYYHGITPIWFHKKKLWVAADLFTESYIWQNGKYGLGIYVIKKIANLIENLKQINFEHQPLEGGWLKNIKYQDDYIRFKLKNWSWIDGAIDIHNRSYKNKNFISGSDKTSGNKRFVTRFTAEKLINNRAKTKIKRNKLIDTKNKTAADNVSDLMKKSYAKEMKGKDYGKDKDALVYLRKNINKKVKFNFSRLFGTTDEHKKNKVILKKYKIV